MSPPHSLAACLTRPAHRTPPRCCCLLGYLQPFVPCACPGKNTNAPFLTEALDVHPNLALSLVFTTSINNDRILLITHQNIQFNSLTPCLLDNYRSHNQLRVRWLTSKLGTPFHPFPLLCCPVQLPSPLTQPSSSHLCCSDGLQSAPTQQPQVSREPKIGTSSLILIVQGTFSHYLTQTQTPHPSHGLLLLPRFSLEKPCPAIATELSFLRDSENGVPHISTAQPWLLLSPLSPRLGILLSEIDTLIITASPHTRLGLFELFEDVLAMNCPLSTS